MPPRPGRALAARTAGNSSLPSMRAKLACCTVTGTAGATCWVIFRRSLAPLALSSASNSQSRAVALSGASAFQATSAAPSASSLTSLASRVLPPALALRCTVMGLAVPLRSVSRAAKRLFLPHQGRQAGDHPGRSCLVRKLPLPVPKRLVPAAATATTLNSLRESLMGTVTVALPLPSSTTRGFHRSRVSNNSRAGRGRRRRPGARPSCRSGACR